MDTVQCEYWLECLKRYSDFDNDVDSMYRPQQPRRNAYRVKNPTVMLYGPGRAQIEDTPEPEITHPTDAIIRIKYIGVCGSDVGITTSPGPHRKVMLCRSTSGITEASMGSTSPSPNLSPWATRRQARSTQSVRPSHT